MLVNGPERISIDNFLSVIFTLIIVKSLFGCDFFNTANKF